jgi:hypothetical protein
MLWRLREGLLALLPLVDAMQRRSSHRWNSIPR